MSGLWIFAGLATLATLAFLLRPLLKRDAQAPEERETFDIAVYKDQLGEVNADLERGLVTPEQAEAARLEIKRRLLAADAQRSGERTAAGASAGRKAAIGLIALVPLAAFLTYLNLGQPHVPDFPLAERKTAPGGEAGKAMAMEQMIEQLRQRLDANPGDVQGWLLLARSYASQEKWLDSAQVYYRALEASGGDALIATDYGEAIVLAEEGNIIEAARDIFAEVLKADPYIYKARYYQGLAHAQDGDLRAAAQSWRDLLAIAPADAGFRSQVEERLQAAARDGGFDAAEIKATAEAVTLAASRPEPEATAPGPTAEQQTAAQAMSPEERRAMVEGMVQRLADHLNETPDDLEGWRRLAKAYEVMGRQDDLARAQAQITRLEAAAPPSTPGPSAEDRQRAAQMTESERAEMIRSMVQRLADRLEENPDDRQGWLRLANAYDVLGETEKAAEARKRAESLP
ncbi:MAG: c-type cytochrome biogenesis protein CcmI [Rhodospirillales bacterium]